MPNIDKQERNLEMDPKNKQSIVFSRWQLDYSCQTSEDSTHFSFQMGQKSTRPIENPPEVYSRLSTVHEEPGTVAPNSTRNIRTDSSINANSGSALSSIYDQVTNVVSAVASVARSTISSNSRSAILPISDHPIHTNSAIQHNNLSSLILDTNSDSTSIPTDNTINSSAHSSFNSIFGRPINTNSADVHPTRSPISCNVTTSNDENSTASSSNSTLSRSSTDINTISNTATSSLTDTAADSALNTYADTPININPVIGPVTRSSTNHTSRTAPYSRPNRVTSTENRSIRSSHSNQAHSSDNASSSLPGSSDHIASRSRSNRSSTHEASTRHIPSQSNTAPSTSSAWTEKVRTSVSGKWVTYTSVDPVSGCSFTFRTNARSNAGLEGLRIRENLYVAMSSKRRSGRIAKRKDEKRRIDKLAKKFYEEKIKEGIRHPNMSECLEEAKNYVPTEEELMESLQKKLKEYNQKGDECDSDDSLNSDSDRLTKEEIAEKKESSRKLDEWLENFKKNQVKLITQAEIQEGVNRRREAYLATLPSRGAADEFLSRTVLVYNEDLRDLTAKGPKGLPPVTRGIFQQCLQAMEELVPQDQFGRLGVLDYRATITRVDNQALTDRFNYFMVNTRFFRPPRETAAVFIKNKARRILYDHNIREVLHGPYGFQLTVRESVDAISHYYLSEFDTRNNRDDTNLTISIRGFVHACFVVSRRKGPFDCNPALQYVILGEQ
ncbi:hypothetical protein CAEBREN_01714 [Caenorhabditis brenneri]|uniref:Uncharacterized protein n=1 Tax=Caenorhabditis brenneri TaxID=135651 RepID=G0MYK5_CAEBE|nr:hypothetical protein CAEBREN_01714 [Caenorhabditis brenneri]